MNDIRLSSADYGVVIAYVLILLAMGLWHSRGERTTESYLLGGRSMPWWVIGVSYLVSLLSSLTLVGVPGEAYKHGASLALQAILWPFIALATFHIFVRFYFKSRAFTPFDYLERRYDSRVRAVSAGFYLVVRLIYLGLVLYATSEIFHAAARWPKENTILIAGVVGIAYTLLGGLRTVVWTDFLQFIVLGVSLVFVVTKVTSLVPGGATGVIDIARANDHLAPALSKPEFFSLDPHVRITLWGIFFLTLNDVMFFNSSDQIALQRLLSTSGYAQARRSFFLYTILLLPTLLILWFVGLAIYSFYVQLPAAERPESGDAALYQFVSTHLPTPIPGLVLAGMLAAVMSTLDSGINSLATVATKDFYLRFLRKNASESMQVGFSRMLTLLTGVLAIGMGLGLTLLSDDVGSSVIETSFVWLSLSAALPPVFLLGMVSRRMTSAIALMILIAGWITTACMVVWFLSSKKAGNPISFMYVVMPGLVGSVAVGFIASRFCRRGSQSALAGLTLWTLGDQNNDSNR